MTDLWGPVSPGLGKWGHSGDSGREWDRLGRAWAQGGEARGFPGAWQWSRVGNTHAVLLMLFPWLGQ